MTSIKYSQDEIADVLMALFDEVSPLSVPDGWEEQLLDLTKEKAKRRNQYFNENGIFPHVHNQTPTVSLAEVMKVFKTAIGMDFTVSLVENIRKAAVETSEDFYWTQLSFNDDPLSEKIGNFLTVWPVLWERGSIDHCGVLNCDKDQSVLGSLYIGVLFAAFGEEDLRAILKEHVAHRLLKYDLSVNRGDVDE